MDIFCMALILIFVIYNIAICFDFENGNNPVNIDT